MSIVTALLGTVRTRLTDNPRYIARPPSLRMIVFAIMITPGTRPWVSTDASLARRNVCRRVRRTSCGYVANVAVIFASDEQPSIWVGESFSGAPPPESARASD